jgi:hypothetical protein
VGTWYDAGYVIEKYNEYAGCNSHHEQIASKFHELFRRAEVEIAKQDAELALAKQMRDRRKAQMEADEPEMMC